MGSFGSGRRRRRLRVDQVPSLDLRVWRLGHWLRPGQTIRVYGLDEVYATYSRDGEQLELQSKGKYRFRISLPIRFAWRHFGGRLRAFVACPHCSKGAEIVYFRGWRVGCRRCLDLAYESQFNGEIVRQRLAARKVAKRLGSGLTRPYRMRQRTFDRLLRAHSERIARFDFLHAQWLLRRFHAVFGWLSIDDHRRRLIEQHEGAPALVQALQRPQQD